MDAKQIAAALAEHVGKDKKELETSYDLEGMVNAIDSAKGKSERVKAIDRLISCLNDMREEESGEDMQTEDAEESSGTEE